MRKILFVCTGNTCRSCMAEGIFNSLASNDLDLGSAYTAVSAGILAYLDDPASPHSIKVLQDEWEIDISSHRAKKIDTEALRNAFLVLTMTRKYKEVICSLFPDAKHKTFTLKEYVSSPNTENTSGEYNSTFDILDPFGMPLQVYKKCAKEIKKAVVLLIDKLKTG